MRAVTVSREYGSGGGEVAARLARLLGWQLIDHEIVVRVARELQISEDASASGDEHVESGLVRLLRSLAVILGSAFVMKFVLLAGLSDPSGSRVSRILVALFDAATFGTMTQEPSHPASPYLAFAAAALFLIGVAMLPNVGSRYDVLRTPNRLARSAP